MTEPVKGTALRTPRADTLRTWVATAAQLFSALAILIRAVSG